MQSLEVIELVLLPLKKLLAMDFAGKSTAEVLKEVTFDPESAMPVRKLRQ